MTYSIEQALAWSQFVTRETIRYPELLAQTHWESAYAPNQLRQTLTVQLAQATSLEQLNGELRQARRAEMVKIALRDLMGLADLEETMRSCSELADGLVGGALAWHTQAAEARYGVPIGRESGEPQKMLIIGMGKLGGEELNFSSDIDLIFAYPEKGYTQGGRKEMPNDQFFIRLGQALNKSLSEFTADGPMFRVDMRLRPFGDAGPLASSFAELEHYYEIHGRAWERYALVKARLMAGDIEHGYDLFNILRPFVYRKYIDFTAIESLRGLKAMIHAEVVKKDKLHNLKLGPGGIREIEFVVQAFQLIHGGRTAELQGRSLLPNLVLLKDKGFISAERYDQLRSAYDFLRRAENRLQEWNDEQTHDLPQDEVQQQVLAESMGFVDYAAFMAQLKQHQARVQAAFDEVFAQEEAESESLPQIGLPQGQLTDEGVDLSHLSQFDEGQQVALAKLLNQFLQDKPYQTASLEAQERFNKIVPLMFDALAELDEPVCALDGALRVLTQVMKRSVYLVLLKENPKTVNNLLKVCGLSQWMTDVLAKYPALMDQLLDERTLFSPLTLSELKAEAHDLLARTTGDDEAFMNGIRQWKHAQMFRVAASDVTGSVPVMHVSDYLTWIAQAVMDVVVEYAWQFMQKRAGLPKGITGGDPHPFMVVGYGKLGGIELGYGSDLDMVFLYHGLKASDLSQGNKPLEHGVYFMRMGQKIISLMTTVMPTGTLYEVDTRLRPNGASGMLVVEFGAYQTYLQEKAWVWEHQALVRTRLVVGSSEAQADFTDFKQSFIAQTRDLEGLRNEVVEMRQKMRDSLDKSTEETVDLKQASGGIVDIEFMVQYLTLGYAHDYRELLQWSDNMRQLEAINAVGLLPKAEVEALQTIYRRYRSTYHHLALQNKKALVARVDFASDVERVQAIWQRLMLSA